MNYAEGIKRIALVVYVIWALLLLGAITLVSLSAPNWPVVKTAIIALVLPLFPVAPSDLKIRLPLLVLFILVFAPVPINSDSFGWLGVGNGYITLFVFFVLLMIGGVVDKKDPFIFTSSVFLFWEEKPTASFALVLIYLIAASWTFSWAVVHFALDADNIIRLTSLFFPTFITLVLGTIGGAFAMLVRFVTDGFRQDRQ